MPCLQALAMIYYLPFGVNFWIVLELQVPRTVKASMVRGRSFGSSSLPRGRSFSNQGSYWQAIVDNLNELLKILQENCVSVNYLLYSLHTCPTTSGVCSKHSTKILGPCNFYSEDIYPDFLIYQRTTFQ